MEIVVPLSITDEEKEILALFSRRQFFLLFPTGVVSLFFLIWGGIPFIDGWVDFVIRLIIFLLTMGTFICLAYIRLDKHDLYLNEYVTIIFNYKKSQQVYFND